MNSGLGGGGGKIAGGLCLPEAVGGGGTSARCDVCHAGCGGRCFSSTNLLSLPPSIDPFIRRPIHELTNSSSILASILACALVRRAEYLKAAHELEEAAEVYEEAVEVSVVGCACA